MHGNVRIADASLLIFNQRQNYYNKNAHDYNN
jgi:hypothetical protein